MAANTTAVINTSLALAVGDAIMMDTRHDMALNTTNMQNTMGILNGSHNVISDNLTNTNHSMTPDTIVKMSSSQNMVLSNEITNSSQGPLESEPGLFVYYGIPYNPYMQIYGVFIVGVSSFGILGNLLAMIVLSQKDMASVGTQLLFHLAVPDTFYLLTIIILDGMLWLNPGEDIVDHVTVVSQPFLAPLSHTVFLISTYLTVVLAIQRYFLVSRPLHIRSVVTKKMMRFVVAGIYVFAVTYNVPHWIALAPEEYWEPYLNRTWLQPKNTDFLFSKFYNVYYKGYINLGVKMIIPMALLFGTAVAITVAMSKREFKNTNEGARTGNRITVIVLAVTIMSLLCTATTSLQWILKQFIWKRKSCKVECIIFGRTGNAMVVCNCVFNFLFYCIFGKKFRTKLSSLLGVRSPSTSAVEQT